MDALKNIYTRELLDSFAVKVRREYASFDERQFLETVFDDAWESRELKERMRHISAALGKFLPGDYEKAVEILERLAGECKGFPYLFFPDFVEVFGLDHWNTSVHALKKFTPSSSSEFAIRPFIERDQDRMLKTMLEWTSDPDEHVRRLASEGCRPRLPWAAPLRRLKAQPDPLLPILEALKADPSDYVRRSVANNLNDISKDHPELVLKIAQEWMGHDPRTDWILKHGCRTLLKKGDPEALQLFGFGGAGLSESVKVRNMTVQPQDIRIGEEVVFSFVLSSSDPCTFRLQFGIDYVKANGKTSQKLFHLSEKKQFSGNETISRKLSFRDLTTRKHYPGKHRLAILVNGAEVAEVSFEVRG
ncbi:DNA alkylation repair protein [Paenibacillus koleovorans]|uniref:DNA alkylation repair protein n=1 Tax=Paenibacillus koleovorans TaxID=121608 RepID=UPI000FDA970E|nr:DNA alkylation repair protein [Paenibacillus koleovorans]